jgi:hypothetical protein
MMTIETPTESTVESARKPMVSSWIAVGIFLIYLVFCSCVPLIPLAIMNGAIDGPLLAIALVAATIIWIIAMLIRRKRKFFCARAIRYAIIAFGGVGLIAGLACPMPRARVFQRQMQRQADVPAIRAWAEATLFADDDVEANSLADHMLMYTGPKPECMESITGHFRIHYHPVDRTVDLVFGGGFGHWGLRIAPLGTPPPQGDNTQPLEDGAWVWQEIQ